MTAEAEVYVLNERPLTDDTLALAPDGHVFPGGYVAVLTYHTFRGPWSDDEHVARFRSMARCEAFVSKRYGRTWEELVYDTDDDD
jgi:hypothetical protein